MDREADRVKSERGDAILDIVFHADAEIFAPPSLFGHSARISGITDVLDALQLASHTLGHDGAAQDITAFPKHGGLVSYQGRGM